LYDGEVTLCGFDEKDGKVYLVKEKLNANTPIHEKTHLLWEAIPSEIRDKNN